MCGRYGRRSDKQKIAEAFRVKSDISSLSMPPDDYNVAPSTFQPVIRENREDGTREMALMRWGLIPFFTKQLSDVKGISTINARAETVPKSPTWREPFKKRRCIVPASFFYEWKKLDAKTKQPYFFSVADAALFWVCGLVGRLERWAGALASILQHSYNRGQRTDVGGTHPHACHPSSARLRSLALP